MAVNDKWLQAQYSVLGAALIDSSLVPKVMAETSAQDYSSSCQTVYTAMRKLFLAGSVVDPVTVAHIIPEHRQFLLELMEITPTTANTDHYLKLCR